MWHHPWKSIKRRPHMLGVLCFLRGKQLDVSRKPWTPKQTHRWSMISILAHIDVYWTLFCDIMKNPKTYPLDPEQWWGTQEPFAWNAQKPISSAERFSFQPRPRYIPQSWSPAALSPISWGGSGSIKVAFQTEKITSNYDLYTWRILTPCAGLKI